MVAHTFSLQLSFHVACPQQRSPLQRASSLASRTALVCCNVMCVQLDGGHNKHEYATNIRCDDNAPVHAGDSGLGSCGRAPADPPPAAVRGNCCGVSLLDGLTWACRTLPYYLQVRVLLLQVTNFPVQVMLFILLVDSWRKKCNSCHAGRMTNNTWASQLMDTFPDQI
jgi:hypothetical protein